MIIISWFYRGLSGTNEISGSCPRVRAGNLVLLAVFTYKLYEFKFKLSIIRLMRRDYGFRRALIITVTPGNAMRSHCHQQERVDRLKLLWYSSTAWKCD